MFLQQSVFVFIILWEAICLQSLNLPFDNLTNPSIRTNDEVRIMTQSCNYQYFRPNRLWAYMVVSEPDVVTLLGDTVYLDAKPCNEATEDCQTMWDILCDYSNCPNATDLTCFNYCWSETTWYQDPIHEYNVLLNDSQFTLNKEYDGYDNWPVTIVAIWDDHDYCMDNAESNCIWKNVTRDAYVDFIEQIDTTGSFTSDIAYLKEHTDSGIYYYYDYNKTIINNNKSDIIKIRFYNFDGRWYRTDTDMLGDTQRQYFENLFLNTDISNIDYHIVCAGSSYYSNFGVGQSFAEPWPTKDKQWFVNVTSIANIRDRVIILTGDVHYSAVYKDDETFEIVTSAMTHGISETQGIYLEGVQKLHEYLVTDIITEENIGILDLKKDSFQVLYINNEGQIIGNFNHNYTSNKTSFSSSGSCCLKFNWAFSITTLLFFQFF